MNSSFFEDWDNLIPKKELYKALDNVDSLSKKYDILPEKKNIFRAFLSCPFNTLKVVFLGQDPYPQKGVATGLCFANRDNSNLSPSLRVLLESIDKYYIDIPLGKQSPTLEYLAKQGVLLLNSALTVIKDSPGSNLPVWESFTAELLKNINNNSNTIFVLFGEWNKRFIPYLNKDTTIISPHPSYCARNNILLPDIFTQIDSLCIKYNKSLIYWK